LVILVALLLFPLTSEKVAEYSLVASPPRPGVLVDEVVAPGELHRDDYDAVREYSGIYSVDYRLVLAIMKHESMFNRSALSPRGARGMLQIMPATGRELVSELNLSDITRPAQHLHAGIYYYSKLFDLFSSADPSDRLRLALASYNAGPSRIYDAQELAAYLGEDPNDWSALRHVLPLLSKRYSTLHSRVWGEARPPHGYFSGWRETVGYVDRVMRTYSIYTSPRG
jgi:membrane-bound lytic murein transglycosylase MltF